MLGPVLLKDDFSSDDPNTRFYLRVFEFLAVTAYASAVLYMFDGVREWVAARRKAVADL